MYNSLRPFRAANVYDAAHEVGHSRDLSDLWDEQYFPYIGDGDRDLFRDLFDFRRLSSDCFEVCKFSMLFLLLISSMISPLQ